MSRVWGIHNDAIPGGRLIAEGFVSIGWPEVGDVRAIGDDREALRAALAAAHPEASSGALGLWAGCLKRFCFEFEQGDVVVSPNRQDATVAIGLVAGAYEYADGEQHPNRRSVQWVVVGLPRDEFSTGALNELGSNVTLFQIRNNAEEFVRLLEQAGHEVRLTPSQTWSPVPGSRRRVGGKVIDLVDSEEYHLNNRAGVHHTPGCPHGPLDISVVDRETAIRRWHETPDLPPRQRPGLLWCETCCAKRVRSPGQLEPTRRAWLIRAHGAPGSGLVPGWIDSGTVSLSAAQLRALPGGASQDRLHEFVAEDYAHLSYAARAEKTEEFHSFLNLMDEGHVVLAVDEDTLHAGDIVGPVEYKADGEPRFERRVTWRSHTLARQQLPGELRGRLGVPRDVVNLTQHLALIDSLFEAGETASDVTSGEVALPDATGELAGELHVERDWLQECIELLRDRPQLIFYGPPGTGKTYLARALARHIAGADNVRLVQFHPTYSYEDFFEGFRPTSDGGFELRPGPMRRIADQAVENTDQVFVLIIDEVNRANLAKVFGELYFLLEYRNETVELLYGDGDFSLPENVLIIGTMNTADRSIALVDAAMRRRFSFLPLHPSEVPTRGILRSWLRRTGRTEHAADLLEELNRQIADPDFKIGPSYFMRGKVHEAGGLERMWRTSILPLLEEHHFGDMSADEVAARYGYEAILGRVEEMRVVSDASAAD